MADSINPEGKKTNSSDLLPKYFRTDSNKKFLQATVDQLIQPGTVKKINGHIGRENSKATTGDDIFIEAPTAARHRYQLEPGYTVTDNLDNVTFFKDYQDYINQIKVFGGNTNNHARLNSEEFYSWDPHINWDKFVNFQNYYWLPYGPDVITITGKQQSVVSTYQIEIKPEADNNTYVFFPSGLIQNPSIQLYRGETYRFEINSPGNPFSIKTKRTAGPADRYEDIGLTGNAIEQGVIEFTVPYNSPDVIYYVSELDVNLGGVFNILSIDENTFINLETELLGKKTYTLPNGTELRNGMKVAFRGQVSPTSYTSSQYFVEGVGDSIRLIDEKILELLGPFTTPKTVLFDADPFDTLPFGDASSFAGKKDYVLINRGSYDNNPWSRYNRWFHKDVIEVSATYNGKIANIDQTARAVRPIIEFEPNVKLFNYGTKAVADVDLIDDYTIDVFSNIEGQLGYNIDGIPVAQGQRILFVADTDILVKNRIYKVNFLILDGVRQIHLVEDTIPSKNDVVLVKQGTTNQGQTYWFDGSSWNLAQEKTSLNQPPLFDVVDPNGYSYGDKSVYDGSTFAGTKIFSYKVSSGTTDSVLGFPLSYRNITNIGDIVFDFNLASDVFQYKSISNILVKNIDVGYLVKTEPTFDVSYINGWQKSVVKNTQAAVRIYKQSNKVNNFELDIFDDINSLDDLILKVFVNGQRLDTLKWSVVDSASYKIIVLTDNILTSDILTIKAYSSQNINDNGFYEIPINLQNNSFNDEISDFTLGEVIDHVGSIVENLPEFFGIYPGLSNLQSLGNITPYGTKFVQHAGPISLSLYHVTSETNNIVNAIETSREDYNEFKHNFITVAENLGIDTDVVTQVDLILQEIIKDKPKTAPYYFSDMVPFAGAVRTDLTVFDYRIKTYPLTNTFNLDTLSTQAVLVYINGVQILYKRDYTFNDQGFVVISATLNNDDIITIYEFENTNGCFVPPTPTKLGIWPKFEPKIYLDTSLVTPRMMIQCHDGSQILAYEDYRDDLILELEKRIFNNIKIEYDPEIFDIYDIVPSYNRSTEYSLDEFNEVLSTNFYKWVALVDRDFTKPISYNKNDSLTFNHRGLTTPDGVTALPGYWRGIYRWMLDTDRPNICPWEMLGFSIAPSWWEEVYGPAPYTSDNLVLWSDIADGIVREPGLPPKQLKKFVRPLLKNNIPVDEYGNIKSPVMSGLASGVVTNLTADDYIFGDVSPVESAWRRSSYYPFSVLITMLLLHPAKSIGVLLDRSRIERNLAGQLIYKDTGVRIRPQDVKLPSIYSSTTNTLTSGIVNYLVDYILSDNLKSYNEYVSNLTNLKINLTYRVSGFTSKEKFNFLLDSKTPLSSGSVFIPQEDYNIVTNTSSPIKKITYSAVIVTRVNDGYTVKGYSKTQPFFKYYPYVKLGNLINVGGISESFSIWTENNQYAAGKIIAYGKRYYRSKVLHTTKDIFEINYYQPLPALPIVGGRDAYIRRDWDRSETITIPYGTKFRSVQEVVDFLVGYGEWLKDEGFIFDDFNNNLSTISNWETSAKEFMFWSTQNWNTSQDKWADWLPDRKVDAGSIVRYQGEYYTAIRNIDAASSFNEESYEKLDGLSTVGSAVISLSPSAAKLTFSSPLSVVDNIRNPFYGYEIFKVDGTPIQPTFLNNYRDDNAVSYAPSTNDGIYGATFYLVQKEQVVILNNSTMFNDTIYNPGSGYRQERILVSGYVSNDWNGSFNIPGFIFDQATVEDWQAWKDYSFGDIVKNKQFYLTANTRISGSETIDLSQWIKLDSKPTPQLLPNWTYKASQFSDFYSLDSDNFDADQQAVAQHLVGYQKRQYLSNIIKDDVSEFKFYQGMIVEKGTQNVLNKLFDVLSADGKESIKFYEEWALRVGQYGASQAFENIEFIIDESTIKNNPQGFELVNQIDPAIVDFIVRQTPNDVYLKPIGYNNNPWPTTTNHSQYLRTPGYVRPDDVKFVLKEFDDVLTKDSTDFVDGDYIWVGFQGREWNVYRYTRLNVEVADVTYSKPDAQITVKFTKNNIIKVDSIIGIDQAPEINGFYKVISANLQSVVLSAESLASFTVPFTYRNKVSIAIFQTQRVKNLLENDTVVRAIDVADQNLNFIPQQGELLWTDDDGTGKWATWEFNDAYDKTEIVNSFPQQGVSYGRKTLLNYASNIALVSNDLGETIVYDKASLNLPWLLRQTIAKPFISKDVGNYNPTPSSLTGSAINISLDSKWFVTGTPLASKVSSRCRFNNTSTAWNNTLTYNVGDIVTVGLVPYSALLQGTNKNPTTQPTFWSVLAYIPASNSTLATNSALDLAGVVTLYSKDSSNNFSIIDTILSPVPTANEQFGSTVTFGDNTLFIGAPGAVNGRGTVYRLTYLTLVEASTAYNPIGSVGTTIKLSSTLNIIAGMYIRGTGFTLNQYVAQVVDNTTIITNIAPDSEPSGILEFTQTEWRYDNSVVINPPVGVQVEGFGSVISISKDTSTLLISAPGTVLSGKVFVYKNQKDPITEKFTGVYNLFATIASNEINFGSSTTVSDTGTYIAISSIYTDSENLIDQGQVYTYKLDGTTYTSTGFTLKNINPEPSQFFGSKIQFMNDYQTLVVYSKGADSRINTTFDPYLEKLYNNSILYRVGDIIVYNDRRYECISESTNQTPDTSSEFWKESGSPTLTAPTTFDNNLTKITDLKEDAGRIDIYDMYNVRWIFSESLINNENNTSGYSEGFSVSPNHILVGAPYAIDQGIISGKVYEYRKSPNTLSWKKLRTEIDRVDLTKIKRAFLYNKITNKLISYLDVVDSVQGKIPGIADTEIKYKTFYDPATYSVGNSSVNVDDGMAWTAPHVGALWWDLRTAKFFNSYDASLIYRNSTWNTLFPGASIDVYEWVETKLTPNQWNEQADTEAGVALGISGTSLYGNDVYAVVKKYDNISKTFKNTYYFWVKNKRTVPNIANRNMSASNVASLIANPRGSGHKYLALTGSNSFSLVNVKPLLNDTDIVLSVDYWTSPYTDKNIHNQWKIINNNADTTLPSAIEEKWFDSLCGKDAAGRVVPDPNLPAKLKYGIENRPRQGMFVNRFEALKQFIEQVNRKLVNELIVENRNISALESYELEPSTITGLYDTTLDTDAELRFINIGVYQKPSLTPVIEDGRIVDVIVNSKGRGYIVAPYFEITGTGVDAKIRATINTSGQIVGATIISSGYGYDSNTTVTVRSYSVLVHSDSVANNSWSIYSYEPSTLSWSRVQSQSYDVRKYWSYTDWYATGYNQFTAIDFSVSSFVDLNTIEATIGQLVKVRTTNLGTWVLLEKYSNSISVDWTQSYYVVGRQNGTIQFSSGLYEFIDSQYGFDGSLYDSGIFDNSASSELRIILETLKDNILIDNLRTVYLDIFFSSIRYVLSEQNYVDWIFKTSFVKAKHSVGELKQKVTYNNDNLSNFEDYINEVKPYRTKIREYVSAYDKIDTNQLSTTDFDVPPVYENNKLLPITLNVVNGIIQSDSSKILEYPWKHWYDNLGYKITEIIISDQGSGYVSEPVVKFVSNTGAGATARAFITNGKVNRVVLLTKGAGYLSAPKIILEGGTTQTSVPAKAFAIIGSGVVRSNLVKIKFDRVTQSYFVTDLSVSETFSGSAISSSRLQFPLTWAPDLRITKSSVLINGVETLRANYKLSIVKTTSRGYTSYSGAITFVTAPITGSVVTVNYIKDWSTLTAADRIQHYYTPAAGELGKDLAQLMSGVDYGGVIINSLGFESNQGWDSVPYYTDKWDSYDETFDDYIVTVAANTHSFTLPYVPANGTTLNVYWSGVNIDQYPGDGFTLIYNFNVYDLYPPTVTITRSVSLIDNVNLSGSDILEVSSTTGLKEGDRVSITPIVEKQLGYNTIITQIIDSTHVKINQILFSDVEDSSTAVFTRDLVDPVDCRINPNGTVFLEEPVSVGSTITIKAFLSPVRLDDPNYNVTGVARDLLVVKKAELTVLEGQLLTLTNEKAIIEDDLTLLNADLYDNQLELNALNIILAQLNPGDTEYAPTVSQINFLVNTTIPGIQSNIAAETANLQSKNSAIVIKTGQVNTKSAEVLAADNALTGLTPLANPDTAIMQTIISNGIADSQINPTTKTFTIPNTFVVSQGDQFIWRKSTSDGSVTPQDADYDTALSGGNMAYSTATGIAAEDILVDGDGFVTPTSSPATEEVVPGQIVDAVAIKVYDKFSSGSANIKVDSYITDGIQTEFAITQQPNSRTAVIVKFTEGIKDDITGQLNFRSTIATLTDDYTVDYRNRKVVFESAPTAGKMVSVFSFGANGTDILDFDYFIGDGSTTEFVTKAPWVDNDINYFVTVDGLPAEPGTPATFKTDNTYDSANRTGLQFSIAPSNGALITYIIVKGTEQTYSITNTERIPGNGGTTYDLEYQVGNSLPLESNMIVRVGNRILNGPTNSYFTITGTKLNYTLDATKHLPYSVSITDIVVIADGNLLTSGTDYTVDLSGITVKINSNTRRQYQGKSLVVSIRQNLGYVYVPATDTTKPQIVFSQAYDSNQVIEVVSSYRHDVLDTQRTVVNVTTQSNLVPNTAEYFYYKGVAGGVIQLDRAVLDDNYIWVIRNGELLTPSVGFKLNEDKKSIKLAFYPDAEDQFTLITFSSNVVGTGISYMQFKDMLNRTHFKRLNANKRTRLVKPLRFTDTYIEVEDASNFDLPSIANNKPGIVEIRGERIEYFKLETKITEGVTTYILSQLRRGTLGTGVSSMHKFGSYVQDIGASETIPYIENNITEQVKSDGTTVVPLSFVPGGFTTAWEYQGRPMTQAETVSLSKSAIETFVGGYATVEWAPIVNYKINDIVAVGSYTYKCVVAHTSSNTFKTDASNWIFFVGNIRLKKNSYKVHNVNVHPESIEGDVTFPADFTVDGTSTQLELTTALTFGTRVTVVKRQGRTWDSKTNILEDNGKIARFIKAAPGVWYTDIGKYDITTGITSSFDSNGTFDSGTVTFDQG